jgi:hypothetical protein
MLLRTSELSELIMKIYLGETQDIQIHNKPLKLRSAHEQVNIRIKINK